MPFAPEAFRVSTQESKRSKPSGPLLHVGGETSRRVDLEGIREILPGLIDALADAVVVVDRDRRVVAANRRYVEVFGVKRVDVAGSACTDAVHCPEATLGGPERCTACEAIARREPLRRLRHLPDASGAMRRFDATFSPILGADGAVTHIVEVWRDVTDRSQLEVQLSHSERLASVGILAAGVAHEINNPLASMLAGIEGLGRWLQRGRFAESDVKEALETVELLVREIERCRDTTTKLMMLGRSYDTTPGWVDVNHAARDTIGLLQYELRKREIEAIEDLEEGLPPIWAREAGIRGICMNLMINAVQAMSAGGRLTVTTRRVTEERVSLTVRDTGPGIAPEHRERIWDPFFTTKATGQGTGLGLSITSRIVSRHGGRIEVESALGQGATFTVELPIHGPGGEG
jgi:PAS domain S-box-containing protein